MSEYTQSPENDLAPLGIVASYIWKPNRLKVRNPDPSAGGSYIPADIVSDGSLVDVSGAVLQEGQKQLSEITDLAESQKVLISAHEQDYTTVKNSLEASYRRMYGYFMSQGLIALGTIMATAIVNLNIIGG